MIDTEAAAWPYKICFKTSQRACLKCCNPQLTDRRGVRRSSLYIERDEVFL
jgi:hypothetical protein